MSGARIQRHDLAAGLDGDTLRFDSTMQDAKQGRTMDGKPEAALALRVIAYVQHRAAAFRIAAVEAIYAAAARHNFGQQAESIEHGKARRLQDQARAERLRRVEALEDRYLMPRPMKEQRPGKPGRSRTGNCNIE